MRSTPFVNDSGSVNYGEKGFKGLSQGSYPVQTFWSKFSHSFCKLERLSALGKIAYNNETVPLSKRD